VKPPLDLASLFHSLAKHQVRYIIVGGVGARLQGSPYVTVDLDVVPDPDLGNLARLAAALSGPATEKKPASATEYMPHPQVDPAEFFTDYMAMYMTPHGAVDVLIELPGVGPFDALARNARRYDLSPTDVKIYVAGLKDIIRSKEHAGRTKDLIAMPALYEVASRIDEQPDDYALDPSALNVAEPSPAD
jgi:hypothetical protein